MKKHCNICGKEFDEFDEINNIKIHTKLGYGSKYDGDSVTINICCECMDKIIDGCYIDPFDGKL